MAVDGNDLKNIGIPAGKQIGEMLDTLFERVVDEQLPNTREALIAAAKAMM
jgi:tRNA nucleotidyltransferase/poly(A) polymerase